MDGIKFEWDPSKNKANIKKHSIAFEEAKTVFWNETAAVAHDPDHSEDEDRYIIIGFSAQARLLLTCFCEKDNGETIRIISSRKLAKREIKHFMQRLEK